jgi:hypothetical protein
MGGGQAWYSDSGKLKHHVGISISSIGASIVAEKLESTRVLSSIFFSFGMKLAGWPHLIVDQPNVKSKPPRPNREIRPQTGDRQLARFAG